MSESLRGKRVLVMGLGSFGGGVGVSRWLVEQGAMVTVTDMAPAEKLGVSLKQLEGLPITYKLGGHELGDFTAADLIVVNPAVDRAKNKEIQAALAAKVPLTSEMILFLERCAGFTIGITGSVGKSTTTALIYEALQAGMGGENAERRVFLGGNIGKSLLGELARIRPGDVVVLELSSFMLDETPAIAWSPNIAVVTNLQPNHLDRHGTMAAYSAAKRNIARFQKADDTMILNADHALVAQWAQQAKGDVVMFSTRGAEKIALAMPGEHNQSNARAALAVVEAVEARLGEVNREQALAAISAFRGLPHRLEWVHSSSIAGSKGMTVEVRWYNDSKATTPEASLTALDAFAPGTAVFIVGGYDKGSDMAEFARAAAERTLGTVGIGQTGRAMVAQIAASRTDHGRRDIYTETLEAGVPAAWAQIVAAGAAEGTGPLAIVLSPACASWDQFQNYERRGELFAALAVITPDAGR